MISNKTFQDFFNRYNLYFADLIKLRKDMQKQYFFHNSKNDEIIKGDI